MKKILLLFLSVMAFAGMSVAQDIWSSGYYTSNSVPQAAVYKNGTIMYNTSLGSSYAGESTGVDVYGSDVYWVKNVYYNSLPYYADVMKNGSTYLDSPTGEGRRIYDLYRMSYNNSLYAVGCKSINNVRTAVMWKDNNPDVYRQLGNGNYASGAYGVTHYEDYLYSCGDQYTSSSNYHGVIWRGSEVFHEFPANTRIYDICYYYGYVWTVGVVDVGSNYTVKVWKTSITDGATQEVYTLNTCSSSDYDRHKIYIDDAGNIYVVAQDCGQDKVYKNGVQLYSSSGYITSVVANSNGVYYAGQEGGTGRIWRNDSYLYSPSSCERITGLFIDEPECTDSEIRALPFTEGFEMGSTDWPCWTTIDQDNNNGSQLSFWQRVGDRVSTPATGDYCAGHTFGPSGVAQEGWLISPRLFLQPGRDNTELTFKSYELYPNDYSYEGVWISTTGTNTSDFTQVWTQSSPSSTWKNVTVDLSEYQGQAIYIAFKYTGTYAHTWLIDDVSVTEGWSACSTYNVPYTQDFSGSASDVEPGYCWYILDNDHSGDQRCWKNLDNAMFHPYGQSGMPQEGWAFSPRINLPSGNYNYTLSFKTKSTSSGTGRKNTVWIALDKTGTPDPADYTTKIWEDASYSSSWTTITLDLSAYKGHTINVGFKYEGTYAHNWYVDDFSVTQETAQYTITANANNNAWGSVSGGGTYNAGATCTLTATPASGYQFESWKKNGSVVSTNASYSFTVTENATYTAYFAETPVTYYTISTNVTPTGAGTVTGGGTYAQGSTVTLTAVANNGYTFSQWQDGNTQNPRTITVNGDATYTASFTQDTYVITVNANPSNGGTVSGGGAYHYGDTPTLNATPASGYEFAGWQDGNTDNPRQITVTGNATYTATFNEIGTTYFSVTATVSPDEAGTVTGTGTYEAGSVIMLTAEANPGYTFSHWNDGSTANPRSVTVTGNLSFTAYFNRNQYVITVNANPSNAGTVSGGGAYYYGDHATLTATAYSGYDFVGWSDGSSENPHQVTVTGNATYTATFSQAGTTYYTVSTYVSPNDAGTVSGAGTYAAGATVTLRATANDGYTFDHWNDGSTQNPRTITVNNNMSFTAYFTSGQYTVTVLANPTEGGTVTGGGTFAYGAHTFISAVANPGYEFLQWSDGSTLSTRYITVTGNATYTALFLAEGGQTYTLTVTSNDPSLGQVFGGGTYPAGVSVEISAFPTAMARFVKWDDGNTDNPRTVVVNSDMAFEAQFEAGHAYTITVVSADENKGQAFGGGTYAEGEVIEISAVAFEGYAFERWNDNNTQNPRTITVTGDATYTAYFTGSDVTTHTITLLCNTSEGTVSGGGVYVHGTVAMLGAFPNAGYQFQKWSDENTQNPRQITVTEDLTLVAFFTGTGIGENEANPMEVYPNPANESIRIIGIEANSTLEIYNSLGELVKVVSAGPDQEIGISDLSSGLYLVRCGSRTLRFVKQQ